MATIASKALRESIIDISGSPCQYFIAMKKKYRSTACLIVTLVLTLGTVQAKPLKVFILAGQSNMQGHADVSTLAHLSMDPKHQPLLDKIQDKDGKAKVYEDVHIAYLSGSGSGDSYQSSEKKGSLTTGFGARESKIGPELTFGITMFEKLDEPILIIKTAWGGKSLNTDFRSPGAGENPIPDRREATGFFYRQMIEYIQKVLADPGQYHPDYDAKAGYEIAGMVWFQGFNDSVDKAAYPGGDKSTYSELLAHLIRDVRQDLKAPKMPFVIGVMGTVGKIENIRGIYEWKGIENWFDSITQFRKVMAAPAEMPEFKDTVKAVWTENYMDPELVRLDWEVSQFNKSLKDVPKEEHEAKLKEKFTEHELKVIRTGKSNKGFHYFGSGKFFALVGEAFAEAILALNSDS